MGSLFKLFETISPSGYQYKDKKSYHPFWEQEGGSDVSSYNDLTDLPKIGGIEVKGNKPLASYHLYSRDDVDNKLDTKQNVLTAGSNITITEEGVISAQTGGSGGTTDYVDLTNKPRINGFTLTGNKSSGDLNMYTKTEVDALIAQSGGTLHSVETLVESDNTLTDTLIQDWIDFLLSTPARIYVQLSCQTGTSKYGHYAVLTGVASGTSSNNIVRLSGTTDKGYPCSLMLYLTTPSAFRTNLKLNVVTDDTSIPNRAFKAYSSSFIIRSDDESETPDLVKAQTGIITITDPTLDLNLHEKDIVYVNLVETHPHANATASSNFGVKGVWAYGEASFSQVVDATSGRFTFNGALHRVGANNYTLSYTLLKTNDVTYTITLRQDLPVIVQNPGGLVRSNLTIPNGLLTSAGITTEELMDNDIIVEVELDSNTYYQAGSNFNVMGSYTDGMACVWADATAHLIIYSDAPVTGTITGLRVLRYSRFNYLSNADHGFTPISATLDPTKMFHKLTYTLTSKRVQVNGSESYASATVYQLLLIQGDTGFTAIQLAAPHNTQYTDLTYNATTGIVTLSALTANNVEDYDQRSCIKYTGGTVRVDEEWGSMNYNDLTNKPQINGVTLSGNKTSSDLNMYTKTEVDNLINA